MIYGHRVFLKTISPLIQFKMQTFLVKLKSQWNREVFLDASKHQFFKEYRAFHLIPLPK